MPEHRLEERQTTAEVLLENDEKMRKTQANEHKRKHANKRSSKRRCFCIELTITAKTNKPRFILCVIPPQHLFSVPVCCLLRLHLLESNLETGPQIYRSPFLIARKPRNIEASVIPRRRTASSEESPRALRYAGASRVGRCLAPLFPLTACALLTK